MLRDDESDANSDKHHNIHRGRYSNRKTAALQ